MSITKGLVIDSPPIDNILSGRKIWEMRAMSTKLRGRIALIRKGSGLVFGTAEIIGSEGPFTLEQMLLNQGKHLIDPARICSGEVANWKFAWILRDVRVVSSPVPYKHHSGAVIWVNLDASVTAQLV